MSKKLCNDCEILDECLEEVKEEKLTLFKLDKIRENCILSDNINIRRGD